MIVKSKLLKQISNNWPNFLQRDLSKFFSIFIDEMKKSLKRSESVEFRSFGRFSCKIQKASIRRNPKNNEKVFVKEKKIIRFRMSKELFKKLNDK